MKHWFVFFLALASVGSVKGQQTITLSNGNMVAGAYKQPPTRTVKSVRVCQKQKNTFNINQNSQL